MEQIFLKSLDISNSEYEITSEYISSDENNKFNKIRQFSVKKDILITEIKKDYINKPKVKINRRTLLLLKK